MADLDLLVATLDRAAERTIGDARADGALREVLAAGSATSVPLPQVLVRALLSWAARVLLGLPGVVGAIGGAPLVLGAAGVGVVLAIVALLGRRLPERFRREVLGAAAARPTAADPAEHRRRAEALRAAGRAREAVHELYLYALRALGARGALRYDPALTDRELLARAGAAPQASDLRELVALHDRAWYGLRPPGPDELERARTLAERVAP